MTSKVNLELSKARLECEISTMYNEFVLEEFMNAAYFSGAEKQFLYNIDKIQEEINQEKYKECFPIAKIKSKYHLFNYITILETTN